MYDIHLQYPKARSRRSAVQGMGYAEAFDWLAKLVTRRESVHTLQGRLVEQPWIP